MLTGGKLGAAVAVAALMTVPGSALAAEMPDARAVAKTYGISMAAAGDRLALDQEVGALESTARRLWPRTFAGVWVDHATGGAVSVAFTDGAQRSVAQLADEFSRPLLLRAVTVRRSLAELQRMQASLIAERERIRAGRAAALPGVPGARYDLDIDQRRNLVVLITERPTSATVDAVRARHGDGVVVDAGRVARPEDCERAACEYTLRSGMMTAGDNAACSTAFAVKRNDNGNRNILSAAHCPGSERLHNGRQYGSVVDQQLRWRVDGERHSVTGSQFAARGYLFANSGAKAREIADVGTYAGLADGATVCKAGITSGETCGRVLSKSYSPSYVPDGQSFIKTSYCGQPGDSGGGVYVNARAVGIHSGGAQGACTQAGDFSIFGHIEFAQSALNATVITNESAPVFDSIGATGGTSNVRVRFSFPVNCAGVAASDFTARMNGLDVDVVSHTCQASQSDPRFDIVLAAPVLPGSTVSVSVVGTINDPAGKSVPLATRSTTAAVTADDLLTAGEIL